MKRPIRSLRPETINAMIPTQEDFHFDLGSPVRGAVHATIQAVLEEELERLVRAGPDERSDQRRRYRRDRDGRDSAVGQRRYDRIGEPAVTLERAPCSSSSSAPKPK